MRATIKSPPHLSLVAAKATQELVKEMGGVLEEGNVVRFKQYQPRKVQDAPVKNKRSKAESSISTPVEKKSSKPPKKEEPGALNLFKRATNHYLKVNDVVSGKLEFAGMAENPRYKGNKESYCVILKSNEGKLLRVWGTELQSSIEISEHKVGDLISIKKVKSYFHNKETGERTPAVFEIV